MDSVLEIIRNLHEERERLTDTIVKENLAEKLTHKAKVNSEQRVKKFADRYYEVSAELARLYKDEDGSKSLEMDAVGGPNEFAEFYSRLKVIKDAHRRNPDELAEPLTVEFQKINDDIINPERAEPDMVEFSDEEAYGRFLDLHAQYDKFINLKNIKRVDYMTYLLNFDKFTDISKTTTKKTGAYKEYLGSLKDYLVSFMARTRPLHDLEAVFTEINETVQKDFEEGTLTGWESDNKSEPQASAVDLSPYGSAEELEGLGLERLKGALMALGLKCGGTLKERAERLFATKGHKLSDLEKAVMSSNNVDAEKQKARNLALAQTEAHISAIAGILTEERTGTRENVERKQARSAGEVEEEEEEEILIEEEEEVDESAPYNPKNLPLGWDGKPIPYWLYKLHGLNLSYSCEICGNQTYKGPKAFQKHFNEWRHSHGMRCLGIPNTSHFANITKIKDALDLWNKLKAEKEMAKWNPDIDEEYEDSSGNVVTRKMYEDLKRQGLL
uniref:Matrin-type domain-containing protein n=1 Tax=Caenorhabditis japonica TaxID=281687 RepID=A0A8R1HZL2_CAEJA